MLTKSSGVSLVVEEEEDGSADESELALVGIISMVDGSMASTKVEADSRSKSGGSVEDTVVREGMIGWSRPTWWRAIVSFVGEGGAVVVLNWAGGGTASVLSSPSSRTPSNSSSDDDRYIADAGVFRLWFIIRFWTNNGCEREGR